MSAEILLVTSWQEAEIEAQSELGEELGERGYGVSLFSPIADESVASGDSGVDIYGVHENKSDSLPVPSEIESEFGIPSFQHLYFTEMQYFALTRPTAHNRARRFAHALQRVFEEVEPDYVFQGRGGEVHRLLAHYMVQQHGGTSVWGEFSPFDNRMAFSTQLNGTWDTYETVPDEAIESQDRERVDQFIEDFRDEAKVFTYDSSDGTNRPQLISQLHRFKRALDGQTPNNPYRFAVRKLRNRVFGAINNRLVPAKQVSKRVCENRRFVFLPLQYPIESRLTVFSPEFFDQTFLIEYLSRILPEGIELFVKQHPNHPGYHSPLELRRLRNLPNVRFLHPTMNAHQAIDLAEAVVVTNNTAGFETLFHRTPLVVLGRAFYEDVPAATRVDDLSTLPTVLARAIDSTIPQSTVRSSIYSLREATYPGGEIHEAVRAGDTERLETIVDSLEAFVEEFA